MNPYYSQAQDASPAPPTGPKDANGLDIGLVLADCKGFRLSILAADGQTLDGTGTMRCLVYVPALGVWLRNPDLDMEVGADVAGERGRVFADVERFVSDNVQVYFYRDGVGVTSGDITVRLDGQRVIR